MPGPTGTACSQSTRSPELPEPGKGTKCTGHLALCPCRAPENVSSEKGMKCRDAVVSASFLGSIAYSVHGQGMGSGFEELTFEWKRWVSR